MKYLVYIYYCCVIFCIGILSIAIVILLSAGFIIGSERGKDNKLSQDLLLSSVIIFVGIPIIAMVSMICVCIYAYFQTNVRIIPEETKNDQLEVMTVSNE